MPTIVHSLELPEEMKRDITGAIGEKPIQLLERLAPLFWYEEQVPDIERGTGRYDAGTGIYIEGAFNAFGQGAVPDPRTDKGVYKRLKEACMFSEAFAGGLTPKEMRNLQQVLGLHPGGIVANSHRFSLLPKFFEYVGKDDGSGKNPRYRDFALSGLTDRRNNEEAERTLKDYNSLTTFDRRLHNIWTREELRKVSVSRYFADSNFPIAAREFERMVAALPDVTIYMVHDPFLTAILSPFGEAIIRPVRRDGKISYVVLSKHDSGEGVPPYLHEAAHVYFFHNMPPELFDKEVNQKDRRLWELNEGFACAVSGLSPLSGEWKNKEGVRATYGELAGEGYRYLTGKGANNPLVLRDVPSYVKRFYTK